MTSSTYLKIQADLLIAVESLKRLDLDGFIAAAGGMGSGPLRDADGWLAVSDAHRMKDIAEGAREFLAAAGVVRRIGAGREVERCA